MCLRRPTTSIFYLRTTLKEYRNKRRTDEVYSKWSYAFLDLRSSECTCARKSICFVSRIIQCNFNFPAITPFSVGCFSGGTCRTDKIKTSIFGFNMLLWSIIVVELTNSSSTQNQHVVFQPTSEQAKYGAFGILKRNRKAFAASFKSNY